MMKASIGFKYDRERIRIHFLGYYSHGYCGEDKFYKRKFIERIVKPTKTDSLYFFTNHNITINIYPTLLRFLFYTLFCIIRMLWYLLCFFQLLNYLEKYQIYLRTINFNDSSLSSLSIRIHFYIYFSIYLRKLGIEKVSNR